MKLPNPVYVVSDETAQIVALRTSNWSDCYQTWSQGMGWIMVHTMTNPIPWKYYTTKAAARKQARKIAQAHIKKHQANIRKWETVLKKVLQ